MATVGIIGAGVVGGTHLHYLKEVHECVVFDTDWKKRNCVSVDALAARVRDGVIFVCLPTPMAPDGSCFIGHVHDVCLELNDAAKAHGVKPIVCIKSTVPPGTTRSLAEKFTEVRFVYCPEFLTERNRLKDFPEERLILCGPSKEACRAVRDIYWAAVPAKPSTLYPDYETGECCKYFRNVSLAVTVSLANEFAEICGHLGLDWNVMRDLVLADQRIGRSHWFVPGPDGQAGFGGSCLVPETPVATSTGWCEIDDLEVGDQVCDDSGLTSVIGVARRRVPRVVTIRARGRSITGSEDHIHFEAQEDGSVSQKLLAEFKPGDWILLAKPYPIIKAEVVNLPPPIPYAKDRRESIVWTKDLAWAVGLWLADGSRNTYPCNGRRNSVVSWHLGEATKTEIADKLMGVLEAHGIKANRRFSASNGTFGESRTWAVRVRTSWFYDFMETIGVGQGSHHKRAPFMCPFEAELIGGWLDGDGSYYGGTVAGHSESIGLIRDIDRMLLGLGICAQIGSAGRSIKVSQRDDVENICGWTTRLVFDHGRYVRENAYASPSLRPHRNGWAAKVQDVSCSEGGQVVAIETASGRYIAGGHLTHNCLPKDLAAMVQWCEERGIIHNTVLGAQVTNGVLRGFVKGQ